MHSKYNSSSGTSQKSELLIQAKNLCRKVSGNWIWENISFKLTAGQRLALSGKSGSGKSLLLRTLAGLDALENGPSDEECSIIFLDKSITDWEMPEYRSRIGYLSQHPVFHDETVEECFKRVYTLKVNQNKFYDREKIISWLEQLSHPNAGSKNSYKANIKKFLNRHANDLSGGEKQVVALFRLLQLDPQVLLLDEPTSSMDKEMTRLIENLLEKWHQCFTEIFPATTGEQAQRAWIWVSHDPEQLIRMCGQTYILDLDDGK